MNALINQHLDNFYCGSCGHNTLAPAPKFCSHCGAELGENASQVSTTPISGEQSIIPVRDLPPQEMFEFWKRNGFEAVEITQPEWTQTIKIEHQLMGPEARRIRWESQHLHENGIGLCLAAAYNMYEYFYQSPERPHSEGTTEIKIVQKDGKLAMIYEPTGYGPQVMTVLAACLFEMLKKYTEPGGFDPVGAMAGILNLGE